MDKLNFKKYQGLGNDFIIIDGLTTNLGQDKTIINSDNIRRLCNRKFGIGSDGLIIALPSALYDFRMKYYNSDGSEGEMCGNGLRCLIRFILDLKITNNISSFNIETLAGKIAAKTVANNIEVNMGSPILEPTSIPTLLQVDSNNVPHGNIILDNKVFDIYSAGMGNPHAVIIVDDLTTIKLNLWGPLVENSSNFPLKTNVHFIKIHNRRKIEIVVWERGCGPTLACGTGACASLVILSLLDKCDPQAQVLLPGGELFVSWPNKTGDIFLTGPAEYVFTGYLPYIDIYD